MPDETQTDAGATHADEDADSTVTSADSTDEPSASSQPAGGQAGSPESSTDPAEPTGAGGSAGTGVGGFAGATENGAGGFQGGTGGTETAADAGGPSAGAGGVVETDPLDGGAGAAGAGSTPLPTTCMPSTTPGTGAEGCFCRGALAVNGDTLYRQSYGIEVFDVSTPAAPTLLRIVPETGVSNGDLAVMDGYLISAANVFATLNVYSLADVTTPVPVGSMMLPVSEDWQSTGTDLAEYDGVLAVAYRDSDSSSVIQILSVDSAGNPSIDRSLNLDGQITSMTLAAGVAHVLIEMGPSLATHQELQQIDLADGTVVATFDTLAAGVPGNQVREWRGDSFLAGTPALTVVRWSGTSGSVVTSWDNLDVTSATSLEFIAPGLLALGSGAIEGRVSILDVSAATTPHLLGFAEAFRTEHLAIGDNVVYASGNDALDAIATACE